MAGHFPGEKPEDYLYHYTTTAGLIGIITNNALWQTNAGYLNDTQEVRYGARVAEEVIEKVVQDGNFCASGQVREEFIKSTFDGVLSTIRSIAEDRYSNIEFPHVTSFSEERDDLSQWRGYADGGYCVAFNKEKLQKRLIPRGGAPVGIGGNIPLLEKVQYGDDSRQLIEHAVSLLLEHLREDEYPASPTGVHQYHLVRRILLPALALMKHEAFLSEKEWRIYSLNMCSVRFRPGGIGPIPYSEVEFSPDSVAEVMVSPGADSLRRARGAEALLMNNGFSAVVVSTSSAPFSGL